MSDKNPKVFISYAWKNKKISDNVLELADGRAPIKKIENLKPIRDICFDFIQVNLDKNLFSSDLITTFN